jgi:hypothetical protein
MSPFSLWIPGHMPCGYPQIGRQENPLYTKKTAEVKKKGKAALPFSLFIL